MIEEFMISGPPFEQLLSMPFKPLHILKLKSETAISYLETNSHIIEIKDYLAKSC